MRFYKILFFLVFIVFSNNSFSNQISNCNVLTEKYGKKFNLPNKLLTSISLVESGKKIGDKFVSWPWTLNVAGKSKFFKNKEETLVYLKKNYEKKKNIDIGCMQISLKYHGKEFDNLEHILDPESNVEYGAKFLKSLFNRHKTWNEAISRYHSSIPQKKRGYLKKVQLFWSDLRQRKQYVDIGSNDEKQKKIEFFRKEFRKKKYSSEI
ncbi:MAG: hypothetical protein CMM95_03195 [Rickettsiales bacterium]|nr:hypothetical protein [Rickettsiales bacterium]|tara:strand:+ start:456 stop:1079 length:624 start_codon:yes stop_codon:yes gene_type:complete